MITEEYNRTDQEVYEMTCECPAYYSYNGSDFSKRVSFFGQTINMRYGKIM